MSTRQVGQKLPASQLQHEELAASSAELVAVRMTSSAFQIHLCGVLQACSHGESWRAGWLVCPALLVVSRVLSILRTYKHRLILLYRVLEAKNILPPWKHWVGGTCLGSSSADGASRDNYTDRDGKLMAPI